MRDETIFDLGWWFHTLPIPCKLSTASLKVAIGKCGSVFAARQEVDCAVVRVLVHGYLPLVALLEFTGVDYEVEKLSDWLIVFHGIWSSRS